MLWLCFIDNSNGCLNKRGKVIEQMNGLEWKMTSWFLQYDRVNLFVVKITVLVLMCFQRKKHPSFANEYTPYVLACTPNVICIYSLFSPCGSVVGDHLCTVQNKKEILMPVAHYVHHAATNYWLMLYTNLGSVYISITTVNSINFDFDSSTNNKWQLCSLVWSQVPEVDN